MISFNLDNNPVLSILFIFILILQIKIKRLVNVKGQYGNRWAEDPYATKSIKLLDKIFKFEGGERGGRQIITLN